MNVRMGQLAVVALGGLLLAGCGPTDSGGSSAAKASPAPDPTTQVENAVPGDNAAAYHFAYSGPEGSTSGVVDSAHQSLSMATETVAMDGKKAIKVSMGQLIVGKQTWVKIKYTPAIDGKLPTKWQLLDLAKVKNVSGTDLEWSSGVEDPAGVNEVVQASKDLKKTGDNQFAGTFDLADAQKNNADIVSDDTLKALGAKAANVPFTVTLDAQGHLSKLVVQIPAAGSEKAAVYTATYDQFGSATSPAVPAAGEQQKATSTTYSILND